MEEISLLAESEANASIDITLQIPPTAHCMLLPAGIPISELVKWPLPHIYKFNGSPNQFLTNGIISFRREGM